jgi:tight adherence protein C
MDPSLIIPLLTFLAVTCFGGAVIVAIAGRRKAVHARLHHVDRFADFDEPVGKGPLAGLLEWLGKLTAPKGPSETLRANLARAGYFHQSAGAMFLGSKILLFLIGLTVCGFVAATVSYSFIIKVWLVFLGAALFSILPNLYMNARRNARCRQVRHALPDAVDLLEICVTAGMGIDMAWNAVGKEVREVSSVLGDEMALANLEMHLGAQRADAMRNMAKRTGADELSSLASLLVQSDRFGTSIGEALRVFAASMRENRKQLAEERAEKMAVKLLFPLVLFIFPAILIVCAGPASIKIVELFS